MRLGKLERRDSLELQVYVVCLVKMVRPVRRDLQDQLGLQVKEVNRVSPVLQVSRVCPDPQAPLVREVNLVTRVFQEKPAPLEPQDLEVSVVSQEREEVQDQLAFRGLVVFQEHQELMGPRVVLGQLVFLALRVLQVCRECLVKGERLEFQDQRVTEVTLVRKDLKVLLVKMVQEV